MARRRHRWLRLLLTLALAIAGLAGLAGIAWFGGRRVLARSVAAYAGEVAGAGVEQPVEITFDARGIPQVWARTDRDLFFSIGWLHASERLFQMELIRRMAAGELAEAFGPEAVEVDVQQRRLGFARQARRDAAALTGEARELVERYVDGINAWTARAAMLPPEFVLLRLRPRPWTAEDVLTIALYQTWYSNGLMDRNEDFRGLVERLGPEVGRLLAGVQGWSPATVPERGLLAGLFRGDPWPLRMSLASNSWVVAPSRSASGAALHASDPHLLLNQAPGLWYLVGLHSAEGIEALGVTAPGLPFVEMGHNGAVSWAFTVAPVDLVDRFAEDAAASFEHVADTIRVKGEAPRLVPLEIGVRGPVVERVGPEGLPDGRRRAVTQHWAGYDFSAARMMESGIALMRSRDFQSFRRAVTAMGALSVNWTYADSAGNIGYVLGTPIPLREGDTFLPRDARDSAALWHGYLPPERGPFAFNPAQGWLASANNQPAATDVPLPGFYNLSRITRATALLETTPTFTRADMEAMQLDLVSGGALRWKELAALGAERLGRADVAARLRAWSGAMDPADTTAALYAVWWEELARPLLEDELGADWRRGALLVERVLGDTAAAARTLIDDRRTAGAVETAADVSARALEAALARANGVSLGALQTLTIAHPLGRVRLLDRWLRLGRAPFPIGGDPNSLDATFSLYDAATGRLEALAGPSMRFVLDWADPDGFTINTHMGQSGNPLSPHYDDFLAPNRRGERWTVPFTRSRVYQRRASLLRLLPAPE